MQLSAHECKLRVWKRKETENKQTNKQTKSLSRSRLRIANNKLRGNLSRKEMCWSLGVGGSQMKGQVQGRGWGSEWGARRTEPGSQHPRALGRKLSGRSGQRGLPPPRCSQRPLLHPQEGGARVWPGAAEAILLCWSLMSLWLQLMMGQTEGDFFLFTFGNR